MYTMGREHHTTGGPGLQCILYDLFLYKGKFFRNGNNGIARKLKKLHTLKGDYLIYDCFPFQNGNFS